jgi:hypothetical protein
MRMITPKAKFCPTGLYFLQKPRDVVLASEWVGHTQDVRATLLKNPCITVFYEELRAKAP